MSEVNVGATIPTITAEEYRKLREQRVDTFRKEIENMIAKSKAALIKSNNREPSANRIRRDFSKDEIHRIVTEGNSVEKCQLSQYFFKVSGVYKRVILHYATFLTYSWILVPHMKKYTEKLGNK